MIKNLFSCAIGVFLAALSAFAATYSTEGVKEAGGVVLSIEHPDDWKKIGIRAPNTIASFMKQIDGETALGVTLSVVTMDFSRSAISPKELLSDNYCREYAKTQNSTVLSSTEIKTKEGLPGRQMILERKLGFGKQFVLDTFILFENAVIEIICHTTSMSSGKSGEEAFQKSLPTFRKIISSLKIDVRSKPSASQNLNPTFLYTSDYEEFLAGNTEPSTVHLPSAQLSIDRPMGWIEVDPKMIPSLPQGEPLKMFASGRNSGVGQDFFALYRWTSPRMRQLFEEALRSLDSDKSSSLRDARYVYASGKKGVVATVSDKLPNGKGNMLMRLATFPLGEDLVSFAYILFSDRLSIEHIREFKKKLKLYDAILETFEIKSTALTDYTEDIISSLPERKRHAEEQEALSSLRKGELPIFSVSRNCSFEVPEGAEAQNDIERTANSKFNGKLGLPELGALAIFQQKGLGKLSKNAFDDYFRLFVYVEDADPEMSFSITEPLPFSEEMLNAMHQELKITLETEISGFPPSLGRLKFSSLKKPRVRRINGYDSLYIEYVRQLNDNPPVMVCIYTFFNSDKNLRFSINYRVKEREKWEPRIEKTLKSIKFYDRSKIKTPENVAPQNAKCISGIKEGGHLYLPVKISGNIGELKTYLMFDSGASLTILPVSIVKSVSATEPTQTQSFETMAGQESFPVCELFVSAGELAKTISVAMGEKIDSGVLGLNFFDGYHYLVDMEKAKIYYWKK